MQLYWGDLHNHCGISYGYGSLENALKNARTHLDFCCVTGHAMWPDMYERNDETAFIVDFHERGFEKLRQGWPTVQRMINEANDASMVTFQSYEMHSSRFGDYHMVSPDAHFPLIYRDTPDEIVQDCGCRAIAVPHHIGYTPGYRGINWELFDPSISPLVEVVSKHGCSLRDNGPLPYYHDMGPLDPRNTVEEGLKRGLRFSFVGSTDHHAGFPGSYGDGIAAVWAEEKTREGIWKAMLAGHTYACTGDRLVCDFRLNDGMMGDMVEAHRRKIHFSVQGETPIEMLTLRRNGRIIASKVCDSPVSIGKQIVLRVEMGWSNSSEKYHWDGKLKILGGHIMRVQPYYRGKNALSPSDKVDGEEQSNALNNGYAVQNDEVRFWCDTFCNISTLHPMTSSFVFVIEADDSAQVQLCLGGTTHEASVRDLLTCGFTGHTKPWHSHAWKMHTAYSLARCQEELELTDSPERDLDIYQAEAVQINGHRAFCSPIFVRA